MELLISSCMTGVRCASGFSLSCLLSCRQLCDEAAGLSTAGHRHLSGSVTDSGVSAPST